MDADEIQVHETTPLSAVEEIELCPVEETSINPHQAILQQQDDDDSTSCSEVGGPVCEHLKHLVTNGDVPLGDVEEDMVAPLATPEDLSSLSSVSLQSLSDSKNSPSDSKSSVVESAKSEEEFLEEEEQEEEEEEPGEESTLLTEEQREESKSDEKTEDGEDEEEEEEEEEDGARGGEGEGHQSLNPIVIVKTPRRILRCPLCEAEALEAMARQGTIVLHPDLHNGAGDAGLQNTDELVRMENGNSLVYETSKEEGRSLRDGVSQDNTSMCSEEMSLYPIDVRVFLEDSIEALAGSIQWVDETDDEYEGYCYPVDPFAIQVLPLPGSETARACAHYAAKKTHQAMERTREVYVRGKERWGEVYVRGRERVGEAYVHSKERMGEAAVKAKDRMEWAVVGTREAMGETLVRSKEAMRKTKEAMGETMRETKQVVAEKVEHSKEVIERGVERTKEVGKKVVEALWQLMPHHALPEWLKDNEYLKGSHRPPMPSFRSCFRSMFRIHSETGNIWTHFLGCLAFIAVAIYFLVKRSSADMHSPLTEKFVCGAFFLGAVLCLGFSWIFHTVYCHSERAAKIFGRLDYSGISLMIMGSFVPWLYYTYYCKEVAQYTYLAIVMALGIICIVISLWEKFSEPRYRAFRACMFLGLGCSGVVPVIHYLISDGFNMAVTAGQVGWLGLMGLLYIVGAVMYATRVPERFFPGKFDLWFHSHQIFHVLVVAAAFVHYHGMNKMADYRFHAGPCTTIP
ncbi:PREDICTED: uncharacterized protein LOC109470244 isoform X1 [Branchiostoma belcheri]|uniref:Uncharacterized protein LOC109470244 isoform X1 n=1 Tax=Branchiostoma belcheri TaxID=7741 RepID=A0A6P4Z0T6_BRABE|nr:PREDICTED: uncharacterized protein LOC109470244 isoform X1 [Branchiostoma belcheri]